MSVVDFTRVVPYSTGEAWARLTTFTEHGKYVPFTTVTLIDPAAPGGGGFIARTAVAGIGFDDVNVLEIWKPPTETAGGLCQLRKTGRLVGGWARLSVWAEGPDPASASSCNVRWEESISIWGVPSLAAGVINAVGTKMFGRVVDALMKDPA